MPYKNKDKKHINHYLYTQSLFRKSVDYLGSKCELCGEKNLHVLCFHHKDPTTKEFRFGGSNIRKTFSKLQMELDKCQLLCQNCHRELHFLEKDNLKNDVYLTRSVKQLFLFYKNTFKCDICNYNKCQASLEFHHNDSVEKDICIGTLTNKRYTSVSEFSKETCSELDK